MLYNYSQEDRLSKDTKKELKIGEKVRFGLTNSLFILEKSKLIICTSGLSASENNLVKSAVEKLSQEHVNFVGKWTPDVTHLVLKEGKLTIKVANALSKVIPIVTIAFILDFVKCSNTKQLLPDPNEYVPNLNADQFIITPGYSLVPNIERKNVFIGKTFTFSTMGEMVKFKDAIAYAKGTVKVLGKDCCDFEDFKNPSNILIEPQSEISENWQKAHDSIQACGLSPIQQLQIPLAILCASCDLYCNPKKNDPTLFQARKTQSMEMKTHPTLISGSESLCDTKSCKYMLKTKFCKNLRKGSCESHLHIGLEVLHSDFRNLETTLTIKFEHAGCSLNWYHIPEVDRNHAKGHCNRSIKLKN